VFSHVMIGTRDLARARRFYDAVLGRIGIEPGTLDTGTAGQQRVVYRHGGQTFFVTEPLHDGSVAPANGSTLAFRCASTEEVYAFHHMALHHGGVAIEDAPGLRQRPTGPVVLAYVRDLDGHKLAAVFRPTTVR
jgi:catechol 2,3-dioxygenase-like lactoylglutathione lyase family enzyme